MKTSPTPRALDHYLVARAQACANGANAHDVHALLGIYHELCTIAETDPTVHPQLYRIEQRLRVICLRAAQQQSAEAVNVGLALKQPLPA